MRSRPLRWLIAGFALASLAALPLFADASPTTPQPTALAAAHEFKVVEIPATLFLGISREIKAGEIEAFYLEAISLINSAMRKTGVEPTGPLHFMGPRWNGPDKASVFTIAYPVKAEAHVAPPLRTWTEPASRVASLEVAGPSSGWSARWDDLYKAASQSGLAPGSRWCEVLHCFAGFEDPQNRAELHLEIK